MSIPRSKFDNGRQARPPHVRVLGHCSESDTGCLIWQGNIDKRWGYGRTTVGSRRDGTRRSEKVHRIIWEGLVGPIPAGMTIDHLCENRACCNVEHLRVCSMWENTQRSRTSPTAVNARKTTCSKCGGPLTPKTSGVGRDCRSCRLDYFRRYNAARNV